MTLQGVQAETDAAQTTKARMTGTSVISLKDVTKVFTDSQGRKIEALAPLDLVIESGSFVSLVGPSGCGKSTLLRLIAGLDAPTSGTMFRYGARLDSPSHEVGVIFQEHVLFPWLTVLANVMLPAGILHLPKQASEKRAWHLLELTGLKEFAHHKPQALSGGMKQRAAFCRAMLANPRFLLLDEPFGALDALTREELSLELSRLWDEVGRTALLITHDIEEAILLGDRVLVMSKRPGRIVADIPVKLPRPRTMRTSQDPLFQEIKQQVRQLIFGRQEDLS